MSTLGDFFPSKWNHELAKDRLKLGAVIRLMVHDTTPPKIKRFVIAGIAYDKVTLATVYINTDINPNFYATPELIKLHLPLIADERNMLEYDSFINCSRIFIKNTADLLAILKATPNVHLGQLSPEEFRALCANIKSARTIPSETKKKFGLFL